MDKTRRLVNGIKRTFERFGFEIHRLSDEGHRVPFGNFASLARAYEARLNQPVNAGDVLNAGEAIEANDLRARLLARMIGTPPPEAYAIIQGLADVRSVPGDVCEFGVAQGETSALIANEIVSTAKTLHLFDSFEGLPEPSHKDQLKDDIFALGSMAAYAGKMSCPEDLVLSRLAAIGFPPQRYAIHKGFVDDVFARDQNLPARVSFAYVDFDFYEPIQAALKFLHDRVPAGAVIIVDDYDFFSTGAKSAVDEFVADKNAGMTQYACAVPDTRYGHFAVLKRQA